ncbi:hypothetical protein DYB26_007035 [Aphanomyces astaci]|uniref:RING-type domain-containing protein n=2 Tax=Aphanomyces astaci TaxID=112090 RepID=A0A397EAP1_APHAT|nr:hypothetical protein DYB38_003448 [Aphanomyces astaci]RHZ42620.1 hypothetical protein DYB26_007035 [Aphanomyces astaci]
MLRVHASATDDAAQVQSDFVESSASSDDASSDVGVPATVEAVLGVPVVVQAAEQVDDDDDVVITEVRQPTMRHHPTYRFMIPTLRQHHLRANPRPLPTTASTAIELVDDATNSSPPRPLKRRRADGMAVPPIPPVPAEDVGRVQQDSINAAKFHMRCPLCLDTMVSITSTKCGHVYCRDCIAQAIVDIHRCPLCNKGLTLRDIHPVFL